MSKKSKDLRPGAPDKHPGRPLKGEMPPPTAGKAPATTGDPPPTEAQIDEAIEETFPASDPPSFSVPVQPFRGRNGPS
jgi:hypothetical protein